MKTFDVAIIGGGLAGFVAAIDLARGNKSVLLVEKAAQCGGRAITVNKNGALFNLGNHALYKSGPAETILEELGVKLDGGSPSPKGTILWKNKVISLPKFLWSELSFSEKIELGKLMLKVKNLNINAIGMVSLSDWAKEEINSPLVRQLFFSLCRTVTYVQDPDYLLTGPAIKQLKRSFQSGVLYINNGWQSIVNQLHDLAIESGVEVLTNRHVIEIEHNQNVTGLLFSNGERLSVSNVISTLSPKDLYNLVRDAEKTAILNWKNQSRPVRAACLDLCLRKLPVKERHLSIGLDQPIFFTNHSKVARLNNNGSHVLHMVKYNGSEGNDSKADQRFLEDTMSLLHPGWQKEVIAKQFLPNMIVAHDYSNLATDDQFPGPVVPEIGGLYVAGDWANRDEFLADAAIASARRASLQIIKDLAEQKIAPL